MKFLLSLVLAATLAVSLMAAAAPKPDTYCVVGYFKGAKPDATLVAKAAAELGRKMVGMVQVQDPDDANHRVEILFERGGTYRVYIDALTLATGRSPTTAESRFHAYEGDRSMELGDIARTEAARAASKGN